ncbi:MAG: DUF5719 family protein [Dermatophilaceae bacterium]
MSRWAGVGRALVVVAAAAAVTTAATLLPGTFRVGGAAAASSAASASAVPVQLANVTCPGPETEGVAGVPAVAGGSSTVHAATAPAEALAGLVSTSGEGELSVRGMPADTPLASSTARGASVTAPLHGASTAEVTGTGSLAPGVAAMQTWLGKDGDDRGLVTAVCPPARADVWLLGGGGDSTRRERLVVANPGANTVTIDVQVYGDKGPVASVNGSRVTVPAHGRVGLLVDALAAGEKTPVVHIRASGGVVTAVLEDSWIEGAVGRGRDDAAAAEGPATEQVVPAAYVDGPARLRVLVPGPAEAVVQVRVLSTQGAQALPGDGVVRVPGGSVREVDLGSLAPGGYAVQVGSDQPLVAAVLAERRPPGNGSSDLAWVSSTAPIASLAGSPLPDGAKSDLMLVGTREPSSATVLTVGGDGAISSRTLTLDADSVASVDVTGARSVWVRHTSGTVRAGLSLAMPDRGGPLFSLVGLNQAALSATDVPVRQIQR